jgi:molecular chaperone HtpG
MLRFYQNKKTLEINPNHSLTKILKERFDNNNNDKTVKDIIWLFFETSLITSGFTIEDPSKYGKRIYNILSLGLGGEHLDTDIEDDPMPNLEEDDINDTSNSTMNEID